MADRGSVVSHSEREPVLLICCHNVSENVTSYDTNNTHLHQPHVAFSLITPGRKKKPRRLNGVSDQDAQLVLIHNVNMPILPNALRPTGKLIKFIFWNLNQI
jgi:hypothetical protein